MIKWAQHGSHILVNSALRHVDVGAVAESLTV